MSFASLAKAVDPGVVTIVSRGDRVFQQGRRRVPLEGLGTGFVYDAAGFVLTNNHVVEGGISIEILFADGSSLKAEIKGGDRYTDIAVLKVTAEKPLHALPLGDSDGAEVGDWVVAIGNPFGLSHTVSAGILSGKGRTKDDVKGLDPSGYFNFMQTDAAINQGNSGGPLLNLRGEVVGINTAIRANANSIGFAIPINMVKQLLPILVRDGKVTRSALGISVRSLDPDEASRLGRADVRGAWVVEVGAGSGADRAGIRPDDVVLGFDGSSVRDPNELRWRASIAGVGKTVAVRIARGSRTFDLRVTLGELPEQPEPEDLGVPNIPHGFP
ncbi:MAG: trypsin-like peptidase domain-containing protein [Polyangiaceae bacterium]|nr:trypsin-like peptidase domain-containing protein [Polyangiaceae bacterium]